MTNLASDKPLTAPLILVSMKDSPCCLCIDYQRLNAETVPDHFPILNLQEMIMNVGKAQYFFLLDLETLSH